MLARPAPGYEDIQGAQNRKSRTSKTRVFQLVDRSLLHLCYRLLDRCPP